MSDVKTVNVNQVADIVDGFLTNDNIRLSAEYVNTYYLYGSDSRLLLSLTRSISSGDSVVYNIGLNNIDPKAKMRLDQDVYEHLYRSVDKSLIPYNKTKPHVTLEDAKKLWHDCHANTSIKNKEKFLKELLKTLLENGMPICLIKRIFYYFDDPKSTYQLPEQFSMLNHDSRLVNYWAPYRDVWFFANENNVSGFQNMDQTSYKMFNKVKTVLQKQKQNVK